MIDGTDRWKRIANGPDDALTPLAALIRALDPSVVGIAGPPGSGKTTLARAIVRTLGPRALQLSMDDFYLSKRERDAKGLRFRAGVGSHDLRALVDVLDAIRDGRTPITIPRYDTHADDRGTPETLDDVPRPVVLDGYFLGYDRDGYDEVVKRLDLLVFLDVPIDVARARRFGREQRLRDEGGGLSERDMQAFWDDVLGPVTRELVPVARANADVVLTFDNDDVTRVEVRDDRTDVVRALAS